MDFLYKLRDDWNFFVDDEIVSCTSYSPKNIAFLLECKFIQPEPFINFITNWEKIIDNFKMVITHDKSLLGLHPKIKWCIPSATWIKEPKIHPKTKLVSMISSNKLMCQGHALRLRWVEKLKGSLDLYGRGIRDIANKEEALNDYMFSVTIENAQYAGYFTEKILDCFATGTIPIYLGDPNIGEVFNLDGIIILEEDFDLNTLTEDLYYSKMEAIKENFEIAKQFESIQDYVYNNYLKDLNE
jgi:hypothetical protein